MMKMIKLLNRYGTVVKIFPELRNMNGGILTSVSFDRIRAFFTETNK